MNITSNGSLCSRTIGTATVYFSYSEPIAIDCNGSISVTRKSFLLEKYDRNGNSVVYPSPTTTKHKKTIFAQRDRTVHYIDHADFIDLLVTHCGMVPTRDYIVNDPITPARFIG